MGESEGDRVMCNTFNKEGREGGEGKQGGHIIGGPL